MAPWLRICLPMQGHTFDPCSSRVLVLRQPSPCVTATEACVLQGPRREKPHARPTCRHGGAPFATTKAQQQRPKAAQNKGEACPTTPSTYSEKARARPRAACQTYLNFLDLVVQPPNISIGLLGRLFHLHHRDQGVRVVH